jgi:hypothetical protein
MSVQMPVTFRNQYTDYITLVSQQMQTAFEAYVTYDEFNGSEFKFHDVAGTVSMTQRSDLGFETISLSDVGHTIRSYTFADFNVNLKLSPNQIRRTNLDVKPAYVDDILAAWNRTKEATILAALTATVQEGKDRGTAVTFNRATNVIGAKYQFGDAITGNEATGSAANRTGMSTAKIMAAATLLRKNYSLNGDSRLVLAVGPEEELDLMNDSYFINRDYNSNYAKFDNPSQAAGYIGTFYNVDIIRSTQLTVYNPAGATNDYRQCPLWVPQQIMYYADTAPVIQVLQSTAHKGFPMIIDAAGSVGAMRRKDDAVVVIGTKYGVSE